jgi:hypothetical protein
MKKAVRLTERDLTRIVKKVISEENEFEFFDEFEQSKSQELANEFIKDVKKELNRPYMDRFKSFDEKRKMRKPTLEEIISAVKQIIERYENNQ